MRIGIQTFHAAHNYGAMLQAYSLQKWIENNIPDVDVKIVNYQPDEMKKLYSLNPVYKNLKTTIKRTVTLPQRRKQIKAFDEFIKELNITQEVSDGEGLKNALSEFDLVIYGSDQIWNNYITGDTDIFWGGYCGNTRRITYGASFGTNSINEFQREQISKWCPFFDRLTVREVQSKGILQSIVGVSADIVVDPVFLLDEAFWTSFAERTQCQCQKYILFYALRKDSGLIERAEEISKMENLPIIVVHPTAQKQYIKGVQLFDVGPKKFVGLIQDAEYVVTNSFHAVAFSSIFHKKVIHSANKDSKGRVESLLSLFNLEDRSCSIIDFSKLDYTQILDMSEKSKGILMDSCK